MINYINVQRLSLVIWGSTGRMTVKLYKWNQITTRQNGRLRIKLEDDTVDDLKVMKGNDRIEYVQNTDK